MKAQVSADVGSGLPVTDAGSAGVSHKLTWAARLVAAFILGQTLFFKFTGAPESIHLIETLGAEPWGRLGSVFFEAIAVLLLLASVGQRGLALGSLLVVGLMGGAVLSHLTLLGIHVQGDGGLLFALGLLTLACGSYLSWTFRGALPIPGRA